MNFLHIFVIISHVCLVKGYTTFSMKDLDSCTNPVEINLSSMRHNSTGILVYSLDDNSFESGLHCEVVLKPPLAYGVVTSIRTVDLQPSVLSYADCENYLEISKIGPHKSATAKICGYSDDTYEFQSYIHWGRTNIVFHTSNSSKATKASFQLTFTAIRKGNNWCFGQERRCHNGHCIWKGLACDGHNNCGDVSDELDKFIAQCGANMSTGESLAVILVTIVGSLVLLIVAAYLRGPKITEQIERLSALRSTQGQDTPSETVNNENRNRAVATISRRNNYGSTVGLLSPESYQTMIDDLPPSYEEVLGLPTNVRRPTSIERHITTRNIASVGRPLTSRNIASVGHPFTSRNIASTERPFTSRNIASIERRTASRSLASVENMLPNRSSFHEERRNTVSTERPSRSRNASIVEQHRPSINRNTVAIERPTTSIFRSQSFET